MTHVAIMGLKVWNVYRYLLRHRLKSALMDPPTILNKTQTAKTMPRISRSAYRFS